MNTNPVKGTEAFKIPANWADESKALKIKYSQLTDADLKCETGKDLETVERIATRLKKTSAEVIEMIQKGHEVKAEAKHEVKAEAKHDDKRPLVQHDEKKHEVKKDEKLHETKHEVKHEEKKK